MGRPANAVKSASLHLRLPADIYTRLKLHLFSVAERDVPASAWQRFFTARINEYFNRGQVYEKVPEVRAKQAYQLIATIRDFASHPSTNPAEALPLISAWSREAAKLLLKEMK